ncbi:Alpha/beta hydrolase family protein [Roseivivax halotolerans]|uniref:Alpha/beta hydrolase family protein n=1 Tax=Roseivivax halotolerans TaxID=93684 RepID=A0A1I5ZIB2_9RHOB|nr:alpha/beta hydrolase [Roseivivax halotolerans]SFQ56234.1 Alpha/beta hydrolase family protein [Roseivivax halotolerans]
MNVTVRSTSPVEALVFIPDHGMTSRLFAAQIDALSLERPVTVALPIGGERIEEIATRLLPHLPQRMALIGQGLGGALALELQRRAPDRVSRLGLIATSPFSETPPEAAERETRMIALRARRVAEWLSQEYPPGAIAAPQARSALRSELLAQAEALGPETILAQARALQRRRDLQGNLRRCLAPIAIIAGAADPLCSTRRLNVMETLAPAAKLHLVEGAGHFPTLEAPETMLALFRSLLAQPLVLR